MTQQGFPPPPPYPGQAPAMQAQQPAPGFQAPPWGQQVPVAPQPMIPQAMPQGYAPPVSVPQQGPAGFVPPPNQGPPPAFGPQNAGHNPYAGSDSAPTPQRSPNIPRGTSKLQCIKYERNKTSRGFMVFVTFRILSNDLNPSLVGTECTFKQNMNPNTQGGENIAFSALKGLVFPLWGYSLTEPAHKATVDAICAANKFSEWLLEMEVRGTANTQPIAGRTVWCQATAGTRTDKTPPGKDPFDRQLFMPDTECRPIA